MDNFSKRITLQVPSSNLKLILRTALSDDLPNLREWKNANSSYFFHKDEISPAQQQAWFHSYQQRPEDFMFMLFVDDIAIGCMGIRQLPEAWDVYNVILGVANYGGQGLMSTAFQEMLGFAATHSPLPITLQVLKHNPALTWYQKNGFVITTEHQAHFSMVYQSEIHLLR